MGGGGGSRRGAGGTEAGRAQVGQREHGAGPVAPPLGPPLVRPALPLLGIFKRRGAGAVGVLMVVVAAVPVGGGIPGDGRRS